MIYTVTLNPSLDYIVKVDDFRLGIVNRTLQEDIYAGGKGINVSIVLNHLGYDSTALGYVAGFTGREILRILENEGIRTDMIQLPDGISRINLKIRSKEESEINGLGPVIDKVHIDRLYEKLDALEDGDVLILAGSIPSTLPESMYSDIMEYIKSKQIKVAVDATKDLLVNVLPYHPFVIKPNNHELGEIFEVTLTTREEVIPYAKKLQKMGARNVIVSMAGEGAVFVGEDGSVYESEAPKGRVINSVGAGDSMVAGFMAEYMHSGDCKEAFKMGICTGSASAFSETLATKEEIDNIKNTHYFGF